MVKKLYLLCFASIAMFFIVIFIATFVSPSVFHPFNKNLHGNIERLLRSMEHDLGRAVTQKELKDTEIKAIRAEIARYRAAPNDYLAELTYFAPETNDTPRSTYPYLTISDQIMVHTPMDVQHIVQHGYQQSISLYITDLRILTSSNAIVAILAAVVALLVRRVAKTTTYLLLLFVGPCIFGSTYAFYDWLGNTFLRIGPYYPPLLICGIALVVGFVSIEYFLEWLLHKASATQATTIENKSSTSDSQV